MFTWLPAEAMLSAAAPRSFPEDRALDEDLFHLTGQVYLQAGGHLQETCASW